MKISNKEKEKIMSTSKAQSMMSSRRASMDVSRSNIVVDGTYKVIQSSTSVENTERDSE